MGGGVGGLSLKHQFATRVLILCLITISVSLPTPYQEGSVRQIPTASRGIKGKAKQEK